MTFAASNAVADPADCKALAQRAPTEIGGFKSPKVHDPESRKRGQGYSVKYKSNRSGGLLIRFFDLGKMELSRTDSEASMVRSIVSSRLVQLGWSDVYSPEQILSEKRSVAMVEMFLQGSVGHSTKNLMLIGIKGECYVGLRYQTVRDLETALETYQKVRSDFLKAYR